MSEPAALIRLDVVSKHFAVPGSARANGRESAAVAVVPVVTGSTHLRFPPPTPALRRVGGLPLPGKTAPA